MLVGVARRGTDRAALYAARGVADTAYVYLDGNTQGQIAHFKIMRFKGPGRRIAIVGSGNLTRGGLLDNEEACVVLFDDGTAPGSVTKALDDVDHFLDDKLRSGYANSIDEPLIARLVETGIVPIKHPRGRAAAHAAAPTPGEGATTPATTRRAYTYQRGTPPFVVPPFEGVVDPEEILVPEGILPVPARDARGRLPSRPERRGPGDDGCARGTRGPPPGSSRTART